MKPISAYNIILPSYTSKCNCDRPALCVIESTEAVMRIS